MVLAIVKYERPPDAARYQQHVDGYVLKVPGAKFRHGRVFGSPFGEPTFQYFGEFEWPDRESFGVAAKSEEFSATGKDAMEMGIPFTIDFVEVE
jgi:hypothetical protein